MFDKGDIISWMDSEFEVIEDYGDGSAFVRVTKVAVVGGFDVGEKIDNFQLNMGEKSLLVTPAVTRLTELEYLRMWRVLSKTEELIDINYIIQRKTGKKIPREYEEETP